MTEQEIKDWLKQKAIDCDENGITRTEYGNYIDLVKVIKDFVFENATKK